MNSQARPRACSAAAVVLSDRFRAGYLGARHIDEANAIPPELAHLHQVADELSDATARRRVDSNEGRQSINPESTDLSDVLAVAGQHEMIEIHFKGVPQVAKIVRIRLRPGFSQSSAAFWHAVSMPTQSNCVLCIQTIAVSATVMAADAM